MILRLKMDLWWRVDEMAGSAVHARSCWSILRQYAANDNILVRSEVNYMRAKYEGFRCYDVMLIDLAIRHRSLYLFFLGWLWVSPGRSETVGRLGTDPWPIRSSTSEYRREHVYRALVRFLGYSSSWGPGHKSVQRFMQIVFAYI